MLQRDDTSQLEGATTEDWLGKWAMKQMLINVSPRKFKRSVGLPEGEVPAPKVRAVVLLPELAKKCGAVDGPASWRRILARAFQVFLQGSQLRSPPRLAPG